MKPAPQKTRFHLWVLPALWLPLVVLSACFPGDKGLAFYFATFPGAWVIEITGGTGLRFIVEQIAGALMLVVVLGWLMDRLLVRRWVYAFYLPFILGGIGVRSLGWPIPDMLLILCWGVYLLAAVSILVAFLNRLSIGWSHRSQARVPQP